VEVLGVADRHVLAGGEVDEGVVPFPDGDLVIMEEQEVVGRLAETAGGPVLGSLFVGIGSGWVGRLVTGGSEGITEGTGVGSFDIY
jgi:hypothetical protein